MGQIEEILDDKWLEQWLGQMKIFKIQAHIGQAMARAPRASSLALQTQYKPKLWVTFSMCQLK